MFDIDDRRKICKIVEDVLENYRMPNFIDEDGEAYPLIDLLSRKGKTIADGKRVIEDIVDSIAIELIENNYKE